MVSLSDDKRADVVDAFNTTSRCLDDVLDINNVCFGSVVGRICPSELQLNKARASGTEAAFLDLGLSISNDIVSTGVCGGRGGFGFEIVNFPFFDGDVPRSIPMGSVSLVSFVLLGHLAVLLTSTLAMDCCLRGFLSGAVGVVGFAGPFLGLIGGAVV